MSAVPKKRVAAILVDYGLRRHSDNLVTRLLEGYWLNDDFHPPREEVVSAYVHQAAEAYPDVSRRLAAAYGFRLSPTIADALTLGTGTLAVDGVVIVSEDGLTPWDKNPFFLFFSQVVDVFRKSGRAVPVLNDKALSHDWDEAQWMVRESRQLGFPLLAGSITPVTFRRPELDFPLGTRFQEALAVCPISDPHVESYAFHGLELLQGMVERRAGGETGVRSVQYLQGPAVWRAADNGLWSRALLAAALARSLSRSEGTPETLVRQPLALLIEYTDGLRGTVIGAAGLVRDFNFAARVAEGDEIQSTLAYWPRENSNSFSCLVHYFERMMETGKPAYPIERTLLTSGMLDFLMRSRHDGQTRRATPELQHFKYQAPEAAAFCRGPGS